MKEEIKKEVQESTGVIRYIWIVLGAISFALGSLGIVLPLLPTVPFYLFAVFCFARGSKRFHEKFVNSKLYANYVEPFKNKSGMPLRTKINIFSVCVYFIRYWCLRYAQYASSLICNGRCVDRSCDCSCVYCENSTSRS